MQLFRCLNHFFNIFQILFLFLLFIFIFLPFAQNSLLLILHLIYGTGAPTKQQPKVDDRKEEDKKRNQFHIFIKWRCNTEEDTSMFNKKTAVFR